MVNYTMKEKLEMELKMDMEKDMIIMVKKLSMKVNI